MVKNIKKNLYLFSSISTLIGVAVYVLATYLLSGKLDALPIVIIAIVLWLGTFLSYKFL